MEESEKNEDDQKGLIVKVGNKTFLNLYCFKLNIGLIFSYLYIFSASCLNIINHVIFHKYNFRFNFTFTFLQQLVCFFIFLIAGKKSKTFISVAGEMSFRDFYKYKFHYLAFSFINLLNILNGFYGIQLVKNPSMFLCLRKLITLGLFALDFCYGKKKLTILTTISCILMSVSPILIAMQNLGDDYFGYMVVIAGDITSIIFSKYSENFRNISGASSLKLLAYSSYITNPVLIISIFISGEYKRLFEYFQNGEENVEGGGIIWLGLDIFISCSFVFILNSSFFISNEKNSSLITNLLVTTKSIFISFILYLKDRKGNPMPLSAVIGLILATIGAVLITSETFVSNLLFNKKDDKKNDKEKAQELVNVEDKEEGKK